MNSKCQLCERIEKFQEKKKDSFLIKEFETSLFFVGSHQFFKGYSQVVLKDHHREIHEMDFGQSSKLFQELIIATKAIVKTFHPWKVNHSCYGNVVEHVHWHIFPRFTSEKDYRTHPWAYSNEFNDNLINEELASEIALEIRKNI